MPAVPEHDTRQLILDALEAAAHEHGVDIVDVEVVGSKKNPCVRVRIDHADESAAPISLDEVAAETEWISAAIDELDPIEGPFTLEVSSPGLSRPLRRPRDFERFAGEDVSLSTTATEGRRHFTGRLEGIEGENVVLTVDGERVTIPFGQVKNCKIKPNFDAPSNGAKS